MFLFQEDVHLQGHTCRRSFRSVRSWPRTAKRRHLPCHPQVLLPLVRLQLTMVKGWTDVSAAEVEQIHRWTKAGMTPNSIAELQGRGPGTVHKFFAFCQGDSQDQEVSCTYSDMSCAHGHVLRHLQSRGLALLRGYRRQSRPPRGGEERPRLFAYLALAFSMIRLVHRRRILILARGHMGALSHSKNSDIRDLFGPT